MREFTKAAVSFTWALSLFGVKQALDIMTPPGDQTTHPATDAFNKLAPSAQGLFGQTLKSAFEAGDRVQRSVVDQVFAWLPGTVDERAGHGGRATDSCSKCAEKGDVHARTVGASAGDGWGPVMEDEGRLQ